MDGQRGEQSRRTRESQQTGREAEATQRRSDAGNEADGGRADERAAEEGQAAAGGAWADTGIILVPHSLLDQTSPAVSATLPP